MVYLSLKISYYFDLSLAYVDLLVSWKIAIDDYNFFRDSLMSLFYVISYLLFI